MLATVLVANVRRGRSGRRLIAVRTNERAAAALGINVPAAKLFAFGLSAAIAALGGIALAFRLSSVSYTSFTNFTSVLYVGLALIGGLGYLMGPVLGATLASAGLGQQILESLFEGVGKYIMLISGISILVLVLANQNGVAAEQARQIRAFRAEFGRGLRAVTPATALAGEPATEPVRVPPQPLRVDESHRSATAARWRSRRCRSPSSRAGSPGSSDPTARERHH